MLKKIFLMFFISIEKKSRYLCFYLDIIVFLSLATNCFNLDIKINRCVSIQNVRFLRIKNTLESVFN